MTASYTFNFEQDAKTIIAAMKTRPPAHLPKVPGQGWAFGVKLVQSVMLGLGVYGLAALVAFLIGGPDRLNFWAATLGVVLLYVAVFGTLFVTIPVMARRALATRANQGPVTMTLNAEGVQTRMTHFSSSVDWAGLEGVTRTKSSFIFWLGGNRPSLPFGAFEDPSLIDEVDVAIKKWLEASR